MAKQNLGQWLAEKPFTLALSSSFFGFYAHGGVAEALFGADHRPRKLTGASAGALVGGALASGLRPAQVRELLFGVRKRDFWDPFPGAGILRGRKFLRLLEKSFAPTFAAAQIPFEAAVFDLLGLRTRFLREGSLPKAVAASCAVPLLFHPVRIGRRVYVDGGVFHKSAIRLEHPAERLLSVFLLNDGLTDAYEMGRSLGRLGSEQRVLRLQGLPRVGYDSLEVGPRAYEEAMRRARAALSKPAKDLIVDG